MFLYSKWTSLPLPMRIEVARILNIPKTGTTHVDSNRIVSDGFAIHDVEKGLSVENVQVYLGTKEKDASILWTLLIDSLYPVVEVVSPTFEGPIVPGTVADSMGKPERPRAIKEKAPPPSPRKKKAVSRKKK